MQPSGDGIAQCTAHVSAITVSQAQLVLVLGSVGDSVLINN